MNIISEDDIEQVPLQTLKVQGYEIVHGTTTPTAS